MLHAIYGKLQKEEDMTSDVTFYKNEPGAMWRVSIPLSQVSPVFVLETSSGLEIKDGLVEIHRKRSSMNDRMVFFLQPKVISQTYDGQTFVLVVVKICRSGPITILSKRPIVSDQETFFDILTLYTNHKEDEVCPGCERVNMDGDNDCELKKVLASYVRVKRKSKKRSRA